MTRDNKLVSIESQTEYSIESQTHETRIFVKMYVSAVREGLIADMGTKNWTTLCVIASYMNEKGECYPTQAQIARGLGVSRQTANKYVNDLLAYKYGNQQVVRAIKDRNEYGRYDVTRYTVLPVSQLSIFDKPVSTLSDTVNADTANVDNKKN